MVHPSVQSPRALGLRPSTHPKDDPIRPQQPSSRDDNPKAQLSPQKLQIPSLKDQVLHRQPRRSLSRLGLHPILAARLGTAAVVRLAAIQHVAVRHGLVGFPAAVYVLEPTTEAAAVAMILLAIQALRYGLCFWISGLLALALGFRAEYCWDFFQEA